MDSQWLLPASVIPLLALLFGVWKHRRESPHVVLEGCRLWRAQDVWLIEVHVRNRGGSATTVTAFEVVVPLSSTRNYVLEYQADARPDARDHASVLLDVSPAVEALLRYRITGPSAVIFRNRHVRVRADLAHGGSAGYNGPTGKEFADFLTR